MTWSEVNIYTKRMGNENIEISLYLRSAQKSNWL